MNISIAYKKDKWCIMFEEFTKTPTLKLGNFYQDGKENRNLRFLFLLKKALVQLNTMSSTQKEDLVIIEGANSHVFQWILSGTCPAEFEEDFNDVYEAMCRIPCQFSFVHNTKPRAKAHLDKEQPTVKLNKASTLLNI